MSEYTEQADKFLTDHKLTFRAVYVGEDCPTFCEDAAKGNLLVPGTFPRKNHIHGSHWRLTISGEGRGHLSVDFWDSYHDALVRGARKSGTAYCSDVERSLGLRVGASFMDIRKRYPKDPKPTAYDMLTSITKSDPYDFENFCGDFGYDSDSHKAEAVYQAVVKEWKTVRRFFTPEELAEVQEIN